MGVGRFGLFLCCVIGFGLIGGGCTVVFEADEGTESCRLTFGDTIEHYTLDGQGGNTEVAGLHSEVLANSVTKEDNVLVPSAMLAEQRDPAECGHAATLNGVSSAFIQIDGDEFTEAVSLDFWFRTDSIISNNQVGGLLVKDGVDPNAGDMGIFIFESAVAQSSYHVLLRLQDGTDTYFGCSNRVELGDWNHVAVSFNDVTGVELFVNGELAESTNPDVPDGSNLGRQDCGEGAVAKTAILQDNDRDWLWGANNLQSPGNVARDGTKGAIDELRFRSGPFTAIEAKMVYESISEP